ncbi:MAG: prenyltransferase [Chloroflexota bacterium]|nr:MAG: prenyltransferase [Chloroflexota bacterium]
MKLRHKVAAAIQLIRPELPLAAGMCVVLGELVALGRFPSLRLAALGFALGFFLSSSAMIFNDYFDLEVDRINAPQRPLPAGLLAPREAVGLGILTALISLGIAWSFHPLVAGLSLAAWLMGFLYNWKLKAAGLWGNLVVSANVALTFIMGGIAVGQAWNSAVWAFGLIAFFFDLAEEIAGDAMDAEGDRKRASRSIAIRWGKRAAVQISAVLFGLVVVLTFLPIALGERSWYYLIPISITDVLIVFFVLRLLKSQTPTEGRRSMRMLYLTASLGLLAYLVGSLVA